MYFPEDQSFESCLMAVIEDPYNIAKVEKQTPELCALAVSIEPKCLEYVHKQTPQLCAMAIIQDSRAVNCINDDAKELCIHPTVPNLYRNNLNCALEYIKDCMNFMDSIEVFDIAKCIKDNFDISAIHVLPQDFGYEIRTFYGDIFHVLLKGTLQFNDALMKNKKLCRLQLDKADILASELKAELERGYTPFVQSGAVELAITRRSPNLSFEALQKPEVLNRVYAVMALIAIGKLTPGASADMPDFNRDVIDSMSGKIWLHYEYSGDKYELVSASLVNAIDRIMKSFEVDSITMETADDTLVITNQFGDRLLVHDVTPDDVQANRIIPINTRHINDTAYAMRGVTVTAINALTDAITYVGSKAIPVEPVNFAKEDLTEVRKDAIDKLCAVAMLAAIVFNKLEESFTSTFFSKDIVDGLQPDKTILKHRKDNAENRDNTPGKIEF